MKLVLIGLRGCGKSTIGRMVAAQLGRPFTDLDDLTPGLLGAGTVREAWERSGESAFREAESRALNQVMLSGAAVIALGGGSPTAPGAAALLKAQSDAGRARIAYLRASPATLRARLADSDLTHRPSLTGGHPLSEIDEIWARRDPLYRDLAAGHVIEIDGLSLDEVARRVGQIAPPP